MDGWMDGQVQIVEGTSELQQVMPCVQVDNHRPVRSGARALSCRCHVVSSRALSWLAPVVVSARAQPHGVEWRLSARWHQPRWGAYRMAAGRCHRSGPVSSALGEPRCSAVSSSPLTGRFCLCPSCRAAAPLTLGASQRLRELSQL